MNLEGEFTVTVRVSDREQMMLAASARGGLSDAEPGDSRAEVILKTAEVAAHDAEAAWPDLDSSYQVDVIVEEFGMVSFRNYVRVGSTKHVGIPVAEAAKRCARRSIDEIMQRGLWAAGEAMQRSQEAARG